jgi:hypothetical protein
MITEAGLNHVGARRVQVPSPDFKASAWNVCRWMAPEVIEHKPYDEKADVFSFGVVGGCPSPPCVPLGRPFGVCRRPAACTRPVPGVGWVQASSLTSPEPATPPPPHRRSRACHLPQVVWELLTCKIPYADMTPLQVGGWAGCGWDVGVDPGSRCL